MYRKPSSPPADWGKPSDASPGAVVAILVILTLTVVSAATFQRYAFAETDLFPLWYVALGLGLLGGGLFVLKFVGKEHGTAKRMDMFLLMSVLCFFAAGTILAHVNHLFDQSEPVRYTVMIQDKEYRAGGRGGHREFTVTVQGETFDINVPRKHYKTFDVGDFYVIEYREGALGEPYYLPVGSISEAAEEP